MKYPIPWVRSHYNVSSDPLMRAFDGLSLCSLLTYEMYINADDYFNHFGMFSGALEPFATPSAYINATTLAANASLAKKDLYAGAGLYDIAFGDVLNRQAASEALKTANISRIVPYGFHYWDTWPYLL